MWREKRSRDASVFVCDGLYFRFSFYFLIFQTFFSGALINIYAGFRFFCTIVVLFLLFWVAVKINLLVVQFIYFNAFFRVIY